MSPRVPAGRHASAGATFRTVEGGGSGPTRRGATGGRRPILVPVGGGNRRSSAGKTPSPGRMHKGEIPKERGERTRARIAEAVIALLAESDLPPTAKEVAARAGVSVRLVFHHFEDMDALYRAVSRTQYERHWRAVRPIPADLPLDRRVERTVQQRAKLFEAISPVRRKAATLVTRHQDVAEGFARTNGLLRSWLETTFGEELKAAGRERRELLGALEAAASWEMWERLRRVQGLTTAASRRVLARTMRALLS